MVITNFNQQILIPLSWGRAVALLLQIFYLFWLQQIPSPVVWVILSVQTIILFHTLVVSRMKISEVSIFIALLLDTLLLTAYVYLTGGVVNPLISLLLLPIATASLMLRAHYALTLLALAVAGYSLLLSQVSEHHAHQSFSSHLTGMWLVFIASALLLYYLVSHLVRATQMQRAEIEQQKQRQLRDDYLLALGVSAADAAHQLNTPLSSIAVLVDDLPESDEKYLMQTQIHRCQLITQNIQHQFDQLKQRQYQSISVEKIIGQLASSFRLLHPETQLQSEHDSTFQKQAKSYYVRSHLGFISAMLNIMDNAAKASRENQSDTVRLKAEIQKQRLLIHIYDFGKGLQLEQIEHYGFIPSLNTEQGMGTGSLISNASIEMMDGTLQVCNLKHGAVVTVSLPLHDKVSAEIEG